MRLKSHSCTMEKIVIALGRPTVNCHETRRNWVVCITLAVKLLDVSHSSISHIPHAVKSGEHLPCFWYQRYENKQATGPGSLMWHSPQRFWSLLTKNSQSKENHTQTQCRYIWAWLDIARMHNTMISLKYVHRRHACCKPDTSIAKHANQRISEYITNLYHEPTHERPIFQHLYGRDREPNLP